MQCIKFCQQVDWNGYIPKRLTWINIPAIAPKDILSNMILNLNELRKFQNDYPLARDKIEIKKEMISDY